MEILILDMIYIILVLVLIAVIALNLKSVNANSSEVLVIKGMGKTKYLSGKGALIWRFFQKIEKVIPLTSQDFSVVAGGTTSDGLNLSIQVRGTFKPNPEKVEEEVNVETVRLAIRRAISTVVSGLSIDTVGDMNKIQEEAKNLVNVEGMTIDFSVTEVSETTGILKELRQAGLQERLTRARLKQQAAEHEIAMEREKNRCEEEKAMFAREKELGALRNAEKAAAEKRDIIQKKELDELRATHANDAAKTQAERDKELAGIKKDAALAKAEADTIYQKKMTESKKEILDIEIANTKKEQALEEEKSKIQAARVKAGADNEAYRQKKEAESVAEAMKIQTDAEKYKADMEAETLERKGQAKAKAKKMMLEAESNDMLQKAQAYAQYGETAEKAMILERLPEITKNLGGALKNVDKMNIYSNDGKGAEQVTGQVAAMLQQSLDVVEGVTGMNLKENKKEKGK